MALPFLPFGSGIDIEDYVLNEEMTDITVSHTTFDSLQVRLDSNYCEVHPKEETGLQLRDDGLRHSRRHFQCGRAHRHSPVHRVQRLQEVPVGQIELAVATCYTEGQSGTVWYNGHEGALVALMTKDMSTDIKQSLIGKFKFTSIYV